jgi:hypothetical protein
MDPPQRYVQFGFQLNGLLDRMCTVPPDETHDRLRDGSVFEWLEGMSRVDGA